MNQNLLFVTDHRFWLCDRGDRTRIDHMCQYLGTLPLDTYILFLGQLEEGDRERFAARHPSLHLLLPESNNTARPCLAARIRTLFTPGASPAPPAPALPEDREPVLSDFRSPAHAQQFRKVFCDLRPAYVLVQYVRLAYLTEALTDKMRSQTHLIIDTLDVMHLRCEAFHHHQAQHWINISREEEATALEAFDTIIAIQSHDATRLRDLLPGKKVIIAGHASLIIEPTQPESEEELCLAYFAGGGAANIAAIREFLDICWPHLAERFSDTIRLIIVGGVGNVLDPQALPGNVECTGHVADIEQFYRRADIIINPVLFGGGLKIKNVEALCHGKPLVTTSVGAEGMDDGVGDAFFVADDAESTRERLCTLITDASQRRNLAEQALVYARTRLTPKAAYGELGHLLIPDASEGASTS